MNTTEPQSLNNLEHKIVDLSIELDNRDKKIVQLDNQVQFLEEQLSWFKRQIFGKRSERVVSNLNDQQLVLEGFENLQAPTKEKNEIPGHTRKKPNRDGKDAITLSPDLPVQTTIIDIPEEDKFCKETGKPLVKIGEEVSHKLAHEPGSYYIKEIIRPKYVNPECEEHGVTTANPPLNYKMWVNASKPICGSLLEGKNRIHLIEYLVLRKIDVMTTSLIY